MYTFRKQTDKSFMAYITTLGSRESHDSRLTSSTLRARGPRPAVFTSSTLHPQQSTAVTQGTNTPLHLLNTCVLVFNCERSHDRNQEVKDPL